jgi:hypothetical protein
MRGATGTNPLLSPTWGERQWPLDALSYSRMPRRCDRNDQFVGETSMMMQCLALAGSRLGLEVTVVREVGRQTTPELVRTP